MMGSEPTMECTLGSVPWPQTSVAIPTLDEAHNLPHVLTVPSHPIEDAPRHRAESGNDSVFSSEVKMPLAYRSTPISKGCTPIKVGRLESATIAVCTHSDNRWMTLERAVSMTTKQMRPDDELMVVVDHNDKLLERCREYLGGCSVVSNRHARGLSGARNTAVEEAHGSIIVFLDDDAVPLDGWLDALRAPYSDERVHGVGGHIIPCWPGGKPRWFPEEFLWIVGCSHRGLPRSQHQVRNLVGANMSFRKSAFEHAGWFVETMGRVATRPLGCEETEFSIRLTKANPAAILLYQPTAQVQHHVSRQRKSLRYFARRCWAEGLSKAEVSKRVGSSSALSVERHYVSQVLPQAIWRGLRDWAGGDVGGAARSGAIFLGLAVTSAGYCAGTVRRPAIRTGEAR
jgi:glucosyl-dolichyl phosphate glucuronosyltransferase